MVTAWFGSALVCAAAAARSWGLAWVVALTLTMGCSAASFTLPPDPGSIASDDAAPSIDAIEASTAPTSDAAASAHDSMDGSPIADSASADAVDAVDAVDALPACDDGWCLHWPGPTCVAFARCWAECRDADAGACVLLAGTTDGCACEGVP